MDGWTDGVTDGRIYKLESPLNSVIAYENGYVLMKYSPLILTTVTSHSNRFQGTNSFSYRQILVIANIENRYS